MAEIKSRVRVDHSGNVTMATFTDERILEESDIQAIEESLMSLVEKGGKVNLVVNFCNVQFLSSAVLGLLIRISKKVYQQDGRLCLCSINPKIYGIFKITRLDRVFDIFENASKALQSFSRTEQKD